MHAIFSFLKTRFSLIFIAVMLTLSASFALTSSENASSNDDAVKRANDARHSYEIRVIDRLLERFHYKHYRLDDELSKHILENFIESLDPSRLFFSQKDILEITKLENNFDDYIRQGVTTAYHNIFTIYRARVKERIKYALQRIDHDFDFNVVDFYELDRGESPWAADAGELDTLWRKRIKNDLISLTIF